MSVTATVGAFRGQAERDQSLLLERPIRLISRERLVVCSVLHICSSNAERKAFVSVAMGLSKVVSV